jgi:hypothetical protein
LVIVAGSTTNPQPTCRSTVSRRENLPQDSKIKGQKEIRMDKKVALQKHEKNFF